MRFTVVWNPTAIDELGEIWLSATNRDDVSLDADTIDRHLADDAQLKGRALEMDRLLVLSTLAVKFNVSEADRLVRILQIVSR
ncbi:MAG TPA: hypothetical protein PKE20_10695 [Promineifilum sp.]|nr:hypothetical protein [Promineifilum sp.]